MRYRRYLATAAGGAGVVPVRRSASTPTPSLRGLLDDVAVPVRVPPHTVDRSWRTHVARRRHAHTILNISGGEIRKQSLRGLRLPCVSQPLFMFGLLWISRRARARAPSRRRRRRRACCGLLRSSLLLHPPMPLVRPVQLLSVRCLACKLTMSLSGRILAVCLTLLEVSRRPVRLMLY